MAGLNLNAPVKANGVTVGKVRDIRLDPVNPERVHLLFAIERGTPIKEDTVAVLKTQGLTGIAYVELSGGTRTSPPLRATAASDHPVIRTMPSLAPGWRTLTTVLSKLDGASSNVNSILSDENRIAFKNALADIAAVARTVAARKDSLDRTLANAERTFDNAARATAQAGPLIERIGRSAEAVEKMGDEVARTGASAGKRPTRSARRKALHLETLPELERLLGELSVLSPPAPPERADRARPARLHFGRARSRGPGESAVKP